MNNYTGYRNSLREQYTHPNKNDMAIVALIRGNKDGYKDFINRTRLIRDQEWSKKYDHITIHEGDITLEEQKQIIRDAGVEMSFIDISQHFEVGKQRVEEMRTDQPKNCFFNDWRYGYKCMCDFWFRLFPSVTPARYKAILRLDDDVILDPNMSDPTPPDDVMIASAEYQGPDGAQVTDGMEELARKFAKENGLYWPSDGVWASPLTNCLYIRMDFARSDIVQKFQRVVDQSGCIYSNRWGDLPLWGAVMTMLKMPEHVIKLRYSHLSWEGQMIGSA